MNKAISMKELQEIAKNKWIRPKKFDSANKAYSTPRFNATITYQDGWFFIWGVFLLKVDATEYADSFDSTNWTPINLHGH